MPWDGYPERAGWQMTRTTPLPPTSLNPAIYLGREGYGVVEISGRGM